MTTETNVVYDKYYVFVHASTGMALGQHSYYDGHQRAFPGLQKRGPDTGIGYDYIFKFLRVNAPASQTEVKALDTVKIVAQWDEAKDYLGVWYWSDYWQMNKDDGDNTKWIVEGVDIGQPLKLGQRAVFENVEYRAGSGYYWKPVAYSESIGDYHGILMCQCTQSEKDSEFFVKLIDYSHE